MIMRRLLDQGAPSVEDAVAGDVAREETRTRRVSFGDHHFGHKGEKYLRKDRARRRARVARASRQRNRR